MPQLEAAPRSAHPVIRWKPGERLSHLVEQRRDALAARGRAGHPAIEAEDGTLSFDELDRLANQLARELLAWGLRPGVRIGLLLDKSVTTYAIILAAIKLDIAFVPVDAAYPRDRLAYIAADADVASFVVAPRYADRLDGLGRGVLVLTGDLIEEARRRSAERLTDAELRGAANDIAYIVYTSGSTGTPKGVAVSHASICNFVRVASEVYGFKEGDRVYQGMTLAFDFSTEELWVPLIAGATIVPAPSDATLVGRELAQFLRSKRITALCCVPTLLQTLPEPWPELRFILVSGEACPQDLVKRWYRPGRRMLNAYGPTEATVTASWTELHPDRPVTIGKPLPSYTMVILGADEQSLAPVGNSGEIAIGGVGLAIGYVNRPEQTAHAFIEDFVGIADNPSGRLYRTGDLGRLNADGDIEYLGRIDTQVKVRGYRIELTEIESAILEMPGVAQAVARTHAVGGGTVELAAFFTRLPDAAAIDPRDIAQHLKTRLPGYMIPAYLEEVATIPLLPSNKADRSRLPEPTTSRIATRRSDPVAPRSDTEALIAQALAKVLGVEQVSITDDFFADLGGQSLLMTEFLFELQDRLPATLLSIRDVYLNPTVEKLATALHVPALAAAPQVEPVEPLQVASRASHALCAMLQYIYYVAIAFVYGAIAVEGYSSLSGAGTLQALYLEALLVGVKAVAIATALPIVAKWVLIGRWRERRIAIWSLDYYRFWVVKQLVQTCPLVLFRGQPIYNFYLRMLGARIGSGASINLRYTPVCSDLLTVGANAVIAKDVFVQTYRAERGMILTGPVTIGADAYVGEGAVLDIKTTIGAGAELSHASSLLSHQIIPDGESYWGSPARPSPYRLKPVPPRLCGAARRTTYSWLVLLLIFTALLPACEMAAILAVKWGNASALSLVTEPLLTLGLPAPAALAISTIAFSLMMFALSVGGGLVVIALLSRLLGALVPTGRVYPLFGVRYAMASLAIWISNSTFYNVVFGDSSFIGTFLRLIGFDLSVVRQTGSNFGSHQLYDLPTACRVGSGTMISDALSLINIRQSSSSFTVEEAAIGERNFFGNRVVFIAGARIGEGNLLATKVLLPLAGPLRDNVGLLGSPPFEIPRTVVTSRSFDPLADTAERRSRLAAKNRHNLLTLVLYLSLIWASTLVTLSTGIAFYEASQIHGWPALLAGAAVVPLVSVLCFIVMERMGPGWMHLEPKTCTIHDLYYWRIERYWKMGETPLKIAFKGTPFRPWIHRLLGVKVGKMVFDDGCHVTEKGLAEIGNHCCLNEGSALQCHTLEDGLFKSDRIRLGDGCMLGVGAFINYGVQMGDHSALAADAFLMKGSTIGAAENWEGNPAQRRG